MPIISESTKKLYCNNNVNNRSNEVWDIAHKDTKLITRYQPEAYIIIFKENTLELLIKNRSNLTILMLYLKIS